MTSDALSRLRAGLDRDEALARAAAKREGEQWSVTHIPYEGITVWAAGDSDLPGYVDEQTEHIQHHDPARVLRQVAAIRKVIERYEFVIGHGPAVDHTRALDMTTGATAALRDVIEMLASAYPAPTETGDPA